MNLDFRQNLRQPSGATARKSELVKMPRLLRPLVFVLVLAGAFSMGSGTLRAAPVRRLSLTALSQQWLVRFKPSTLQGTAAALHSRAGARLLGAIPQLGIQKIALRNPEAAAVYASNPNVLYIEPNRLRKLCLAEPDDPAYTDFDYGLPTEPEMATWFEWDAHLLDAHGAWSAWPGRYYTRQSGKGSDAVRIAVIDTGVDYTHPDFINKNGTSTSVSDGGQLLRPLDKTILDGVETDEAADDYGHGTHVTGIAAASTNNGIGCTGNGYNANVISLKVVDAADNGTSDDIARAIVYAADNGALVCNLSLGLYDYSQAEQDAVNYAWDKGTLCIAAAGNDGVDNKPLYPAALDRVLAVAATSARDQLATYSTYGANIGVAAPGGDFDFDLLWFLNVYSTMPTYEVTMTGSDFGYQMNYDYLQGTSMACPQVVGLAALYAGKMGFTQSTPDVCLKIWRGIQQGADDILGLANGGWSSFYGYGRINLAGTLNLDVNPNPRGATVGCVTGQVRYRGTLIPNAVITARPVGGGPNTSGSSRLDGGYRVMNAPAGTYNITASVFGESQTIQNVEVVEGCDTPGILFDISGGGGGGNPPDPPVNLGAEARSNRQINLTWDDRSNNETGFKIERKGSAGGNWSPVTTVGAGSTNYLDGGLQSSRQYWYRVRATNNNGDSANSNEADATTMGDPPVAPTTLKAKTASSTKINLSWRDRSDAETSFRIERKGGGVTSFEEIGSVGPNITKYADAGCRPNKTYKYRVRARSADGDSGYSNVAKGKTKQN